MRKFYSIYKRILALISDFNVFNHFPPLPAPPAADTVYPLLLLFRCFSIYIFSLLMRDALMFSSKFNFPQFSINLCIHSHSIENMMFNWIKRCIPHDTRQTARRFSPNPLYSRAQHTIFNSTQRSRRSTRKYKICSPSGNDVDGGRITRHRHSCSVVQIVFCV